jgi:hypothetical protein
MTCLAIDHKGLVVQEFTDCTSRVEIRYVGGPRPGLYGLRVFIDQEYAGRLDTPDRRAQVRVVTPGRHTIRLEYAGLWRSETVDVNVPAGEIVTLECGFARPKLGDYVPAIAGHLAIIPLCKFELYLTALAAFGLAVAVLGFAVWRQWITPGGYLFLRPLAEPRLARAAVLGITRRPRMTIRQAMVVVAAAAGLLGIAGEDRRNQRRAELDILRERYRYMAAMHAGQESMWTKQQAKMALEEVSLVRDMEALSALVRSDQEQDPWNTRLETARQMLLDHQARRASYARRADHEAQAKGKYLRAAARPWDPVDGDR